MDGSKKGFARRLIGSGWRFRALSAVTGRVKPSLAILAYHRILNIDEHYNFDAELVSASTEQFREQVAWLSSNCEILTFADLDHSLSNGTKIPKRSVIITFDDGFRDNYENAFRILSEFGAPATFYVSTAYIGQQHTFWFDWLAALCLTPERETIEIESLGIDQPLPPERSERVALHLRIVETIKRVERDQHLATVAELKDSAANDAKRVRSVMTWDQIRKMSTQGMEFGSHGVEHVMLAKLNDEQLRAEMVESKQKLEQELSKQVITAAYPVGGEDAVGSRVEAAAKQAGYRFACTYINGANRLASMNDLALHRSHVERYMDLNWLAVSTALPILN